MINFSFLNFIFGILPGFLNNGFCSSSECRFQRNLHLPALYTSQKRNPEFGPLSVNMGTAATSIRCCCLAAVIQQLYF